MTASEVAKYIYNQLIAAGTTKEGACAVLGNLQAESGFIVNNLEDSKSNVLGLSDVQYTEQVDNNTYTNFVHDAAGYGLAQWTYYTRKQGLLNYAKSKNKSIGDLQTQVEYLIKEFKETFSSIWNQLKTSKDLYNLTWILLDKWENPAIKNITLRYQYAQTWYNQVDSITEQINTKTGISQDEAIQKVLNIARKEIGYHEGTNSYIKYAEGSWDDQFYGWNVQNQPWCDLFVDFCFVSAFGLQDGAAMTYQTLGRGSALCSASMQYYKNNGAFYTWPQPGDQVFFYYSGAVNHTGIVESVNGSGENWTGITTIEGNANDQVLRCAYQRGSSIIAGFGRPKWSLVTEATFVPAPPPTTVSIPSIPSIETIQQGSKGDLVKMIQTKLIALGYSCGPDGADGDFGPNTLAAVLKFQREHNLAADGIVGPLTRTAINRAYEVAQEFKVGETVNFTGNTHYISAIAESGYPCTPGKAKITAISKNNNTRHPYHIVHEDNRSNVYGWVDSNTIEKMYVKSE